MRVNKINVNARRSRQAGFSMLEMLMVIGIIGILAGFGTMSYMKQVAASRVDAGIQMLNASFKQARQSAIAMRKNRRVVIDSGLLDIEINSSVTVGSRMEPAQIWIEGKICEEYPFESLAYCKSNSNDLPNAKPLNDPQKFPDGVMVADLDGLIPNLGSNAQIFYIEFNSRGAISKVYFDGKEQTTTSNLIAPVIHLARDSEMFMIDDTSGDYTDSIGSFSSSKMKWVDPPSELNQERYKVQTIEIVRLTGKTRVYDYAIMNPWPMDELFQ